MLFDLEPIQVNAVDRAYIDWQDTRVGIRSLQLVEDENTACKTESMPSNLVIGLVIAAVVA